MIAFFATLLLTTSASPAVADPAPAVRDVLGFADSLFAEGDYYRAIGEAKRFVYLHPQDARVPEARLLIGRSYLAGEQWAAAAASLEALALEVSTGKVGADAAFALADARMGSADYDLAALEYRRFAEDFPSDERAAFADLRTAWARIFAADVLAVREPAQGQVAFASVARSLKTLPPTHGEAERAKALAAGADKLARLPRRSPAAAGVMSAVIPGLGQVYASRYADGLIAFVVNGLFIGGAYESFNRGNNVAGAVLVLFEMGWYSGNIYSAINSAHRFNNDRRTGLIRVLKRDLYLQAAPRVSMRGTTGGKADGAVAGLGGRF